MEYLLSYYFMQIFIPVEETALDLESHNFVCFITVNIIEKAMASHSSTLAWKIPWMEERGGPQYMGSPRVRHD